MAYQNVGTPRFFVNTIEWLINTGYEQTFYFPSSLVSKDILRTLPVSHDEDFVHAIFSIPPGVMNDNSFIAILNNTLASQGLGYNINAPESIDGSLSAEYAVGNLYKHNIVNSPIGTGFEVPQHNGFNIAEFEMPGIGFFEIWSNSYSNIGSIVVGTYFEMPHSPDLSLTMSREYGGIKNIETKGGASLSNAFYTKPPMWGNAGAWELHAGDSTTQKLSRSGRRIWDLSFSYLSARSVFGSNQSLTEAPWGIITEEQGWDGDDIHDTLNTFNKHLLISDDFYSQVIHKTNGGQLPFIFQPNVNDITQFAICKFDMKSFKFEQVANGVYNVKLKIREVW